MTHKMFTLTCPNNCCSIQMANYIVFKGIIVNCMYCFSPMTREPEIFDCGDFTVRAVPS